MFITHDGVSDNAPDGNGSSGSIHPTAVGEFNEVSAFRPHRVRVGGVYVNVFDYDVHVYSRIALVFRGAQRRRPHLKD